MNKAITVFISILSFSMVFAVQSKLEILKNKPGYSSSFAKQHEVFIPRSEQTKPEPMTLGELHSLPESESPRNIHPETTETTETRDWANWLGAYGIFGPQNTTGGTMIGDCYYGVAWGDQWLYYVCGVSEGNGGGYENRDATWVFPLDSNYGMHYSLDYNAYDGLFWFGTTDGYAVAYDQGGTLYYAYSLPSSHSYYPIIEFDGPNMMAANGFSDFHGNGLYVINFWETGVSTYRYPTNTFYNLADIEMDSFGHMYTLDTNGNVWQWELDNANGVYNYTSWYMWVILYAGDGSAYGIAYSEDSHNILFSDFGMHLYVMDTGYSSCDDADNDGICDDVDDCVGAYDECGVCNGGNADKDCAGVCFGDSVLDDCGICGGDGSDDLGCGCFEPGPSGCDNACGSTLELDECGECGGSGPDQHFTCSGFKPETKDALQTAANLWVSSPESAEATYGHISDWDVSLITDMQDLFRWLTSFNSDISSWDVSNVTVFEGMFRNNQSFNYDISGWDVSSAVDMESMFAAAQSFNQDLNDWDVSNVTNMSALFGWTAVFNGDISSWDVSNVTNFGYMFENVNGLTDENKCAIHTAFSLINDAWPYNWSQNQGCDGVCYSGLVDDCAGVCGGPSTTDDCGVCDGGNADMDCAGVCGGSATIDDCGVCDGENADMDCAGVCGGSSTLDYCGICDGDNVANECEPAGCADGTVDDCSGDGDCAPASWVGDGWCDGADQPFGYDLTCYDSDGGDCGAASSCADGTVDDCAGDGDCAPLSWVGDGWCDGTDQPFGYDLTCYDNDGGDCSRSDEGSMSDAWEAKKASQFAMMIEYQELLERKLAEDTGSNRDDCGGTGPDVGCDGVCFSGLVDDCAGVCNGDSDLDCVGTCADAGTLSSWNGDGWCDDGAFGLDLVCEEYNFDGGDCDDACGVPNGNNDCLDCAGVPNGDSVLDDCGVCGGDSTSYDMFDVTDVVVLVGHILDHTDGACLDYNGDGVLNVVDVVQIVELILNTSARVSYASEVTLSRDANSLVLDADGFVGAIEMRLSHGNNFEIEFDGSSMVSDYRTAGNYTTLIVVAPESGKLLTASSDFEIEDMMAANADGELEVTLPVTLGLSAAYPNPFNPTTNIDLNMSAAEVVSVNVYSINGQLIETIHSGNLSAGSHTMTWNASHLSSGVYFIKAATSSDVVSQKVMLLK